MLTRLRGKNEEGFTLIELMVVVLIIAILIAIAIPTFIGMRDRGYDSQSKANLRNGITAAKTYFTDNETYTGITAASLDAIETAVPFENESATVCQTSLPADGNDITDHATVDVYTVASTGEALCLATWTKGSDRWYFFSSDSNGVETLVLK